MLGPTLWNLFFEDSQVPIAKAKFKDMSFADDLNAYKCVRGNTRNATAIKLAKHCQAELHKWGTANNVCFDPKKENISVFSMRDLVGDGCKLLGVYFDTKLSMHAAICTLKDEANWKLRTIWSTPL